MIKINRITLYIIIFIITIGGILVFNDINHDLLEARKWRKLYNDFEILVTEEKYMLKLLKDNKENTNYIYRIDINKYHKPYLHLPVELLYDATLRKSLIQDKVELQNQTRIIINNYKLNELNETSDLNRTIKIMEKRLDDLSRHYSELNQRDDHQYELLKIYRKIKFDVILHYLLQDDKTTTDNIDP